MKKFLSLMLAVIMCITVATTLASCGHEHEYKTEWSSDATHHWHACADAECTEPADKAEHTWDAGTVKSFADTEYACTVCGYKKTVAAQTTVSADQWAAAMDLGENYTLICKQTFPGEGVEVFTEKRAGNLFSSVNEEFAEGETVAADSSCSYGKIDGEVYYRYSAQYDENDQLVGYHRWASEDTAQEEIDEVLGEYFPESIRDMSAYTYNATTCYYERESAVVTEFGDMVLQNIKVGFKDGKLVCISFEMEMAPENVLKAEMDITYGGATVTLPADELILN